MQPTVHSSFNLQLVVPLASGWWAGTFGIVHISATVSCCLCIRGRNTWRSIATELRVSLGCIQLAICQTVTIRYPVCQWHAHHVMYHGSISCTLSKLSGTLAHLNLVSDVDASKMEFTEVISCMMVKKQFKFMGSITEEVYAGNHHWACDHSWPRQTPHVACTRIKNVVRNYLVNCMVCVL